MAARAGSARRGGVLIRADAGPGVGLGHLQRCLSLAEALRRGGAECAFVLNERAGAAGRVEAAGFEAPEAAGAPSWSGADMERTIGLAAQRGCTAAVVDGYGAGPDFLRGLREGGLYVAAVDDLCRELFPCQLAVNGGVHAKELRPQSSTGDTAFLFGPEYALIRPELWNVPARAVRAEVSSILLTLGGTDDFNLMPVLLRALDALPGVFAVTAILGTYFTDGEAILRAAAECGKKVRLVESPTSVRDLMLGADLAVSAGGQTLYELAVAGTPAVAIQLAENQAGQLRGFAGAGFARLAGVAGRDDVVAGVREQVLPLLADAAAREAMAAAGRALIDGRGAIRVAERILGEVSPAAGRPIPSRQGAVG
ncbi:MAG: UDP-2,4-diacetamido-2,4,6-trideoxy-beta-L-altropyranose hydrolase [Candidatus Tectomicrobia bacterium]|uniref:UDP-2,4-diacetamido-2,4, 6-trideoxy-beta-L-altropyranose hydrolase n=1 Tax=Tectimicrobiota bacterium TaxID=2528274 RepID=A0A932MKF2_UNCTE|nr:UDP-2,4-diacetamido-2,4,6-trideoxy-beta-L-altropyranose hydrolase [Candidatus Tectomicrobia bacterium]